MTADAMRRSACCVSRLARVVVAILGLLAGLAAAPAAEAADKVRVVATIPDLRALTEAIGGDLVEVDALARPSQNPHDLEVRPSLMVKVRRADLFVMNGLDLDQWAEVVVQGANNATVGPGGVGRVDGSRGIPVLEVPTTRVDRSMGDVHPSGNPHYTVDPGMAPIVTGNILEGLARVAPGHRTAFERQRTAFLGRLEQAMARWRQLMEPVKGAKVVAYHNDWPYLLARFGLAQAGTIEERPGIPPSPGHLARLIQRMKEEKVKVVVVEPWSDQRLAARVAQEAGAKVVVLNAKLGASGADAYITSTDANVTTLAQSLR
jgi:zinc/manganese transport system substrate-binding protein